MFGLKTIPVEVRCDGCGAKAKVSNLTFEIALPELIEFFKKHTRKHSTGQSKTHFSWNEEMKPLCIAAYERLRGIHVRTA
jgi:hypothetical protein